MVAIRFFRVGKPHVHHFRLVAIDSRKGPRTPPLEVLAAYNPKAKDGEKIKNFKQERVDHWIKCGAQISEGARRLLKKEKAIA